MTYMNKQVTDIKFVMLNNREHALSYKKIAMFFDSFDSTIIYLPFHQ